MWENQILTIIKTEINSRFFYATIIMCNHIHAIRIPVIPNTTPEIAYLFFSYLKEDAPIAIATPPNIIAINTVILKHSIAPKAQLIIPVINDAFAREFLLFIII